MNLFYWFDIVVLEIMVLFIRICYPLGMFLVRVNIIYLDLDVYVLLT